MSSATASATMSFDVDTVFEYISDDLEELLPENPEGKTKKRIDRLNKHILHLMEAYKALAAQQVQQAQQAQTQQAQTQQVDPELEKLRTLLRSTERELDEKKATVERFMQQLAVASKPPTEEEVRRMIVDYTRKHGAYLNKRDGNVVLLNMLRSIETGPMDDTTASNKESVKQILGEISQGDDENEEEEPTTSSSGDFRSQKPKLTGADRYTLAAASPSPVTSQQRGKPPRTTLVVKGNTKPTEATTSASGADTGAGPSGAGPSEPKLPQPSPQLKSGTTKVVRPPSPTDVDDEYERYDGLDENGLPTDGRGKAGSYIEERQKPSRVRSSQPRVTPPMASAGVTQDSASVPAPSPAISAISAHRGWSSPAATKDRTGAHFVSRVDDFPEVNEVRDVVVHQVKPQRNPTYIPEFNNSANHFSARKINMEDLLSTNDPAIAAMYNESFKLRGQMIAKQNADAAKGASSTTRSK